jgi:hypothetical protein
LYIAIDVERPRPHPVLTCVGQSPVKRPESPGEAA